MESESHTSDAGPAERGSPPAEAGETAEDAYAGVEDAEYAEAAADAPAGVERRFDDIEVPSFLRRRRDDR